MSSEKVSDGFLREWVSRLRQPGRMDDPAAEQSATAFEELLQRRKDGGSPEEFVMRMALMAKDVRPEARAHFLHSLGEIHRHTMLVRQFMEPPLSDAEGETVAKTAEVLSRRVSTIQCDGYGMHPTLGLVKTHEPHPISTPCPGKAG